MRDSSELIKILVKRDCTDKNKRKAVENGGESAGVVWLSDCGTEEKRRFCCITEMLGFSLGANRVDVIRDGNSDDSFLPQSIKMIKTYSDLEAPKSL